MTQISFKLVFIVCVVLVHSCNAYKLLVLFPFPGKSHGILGEGYVRNLIKAGHEVTYVAAVPLKYDLPGLRQIDVSRNFELLSIESMLNLTSLLNNDLSITDSFKHFYTILEMMKATVQHEDLQALMMDPTEQFDAVIAEWMFLELYSGLASVFGCPLIWSSSMEPHQMVLSLMDESPNLAYVPDQTTQAKLPFSFLERVQQLVMNFLFNVPKWFLDLQSAQMFTELYGPAAALRGRQLPSLSVAMYNASLMLGNSHVSSGYPTRLPQSYKPIGGYHIEEEIKPLSKEWQKLMDEAPHGVIYFSMGSMLRSKHMPEQIRNGLLEMFGSLKQTVIWKFEEAWPNVPKNVHIVDWAPQQSLLAHPNCLLFITHGGLLSTTEALHFGVPLIGMPIYADQFNNVNSAENKGFAKRVTLNYDGPDNLKAAIEEMLGNPKYRERVKELSFIYHDRPVLPSVELVHWVEHVIKTKGAPHLRSPALDMPFYQKMYLDLVALILAVVLVIKYTFKFLFRSKKVDVIKKNK